MKIFCVKTQKIKLTCKQYTIPFRPQLSEALPLLCLSFGQECLKNLVLCYFYPEKETKIDTLDIYKDNLVSTKCLHNKFL